MPSWTRVLTVIMLAAVAQPATADELLTLERAIQDSLAHNRSLQGARAAVGEAGARSDEARASFFPRISFTEAWQRSDQPVFVFSSLMSARRFTAASFAIDALNNPDALGFFHGAFSVEQLLFDGGARAARVDSAARGRDIAQAGADQAAAGLVLAVTATYGRLIAAQAARGAADAALAAAEEDLRRAEHRRDVGTVTDADVLAIAVHAAAVRQRAIQGKSDAATAAAELNRLMGAPVERTYDTQEPADPRDASSSTADLSVLFAEADAARPELRRAEAARKIAENARREARSGWLPQVAAQAGYEVNGTRFSERAGAWMVGGELRWSLSTGGAEAARARAAVEAATRADAEAADTRSAVHVEVLTAVRRLEAARAREEVGRSAVEQARESQRIVRDRYEAGLAGVNDVLRVASAVLDAEAQRIGAVVDALTSAAELRKALGRN